MTSDRDELARQLHLSRHGGGSWVGAMDDDFDDTPGSEDMVAAEEFVVHMREHASSLPARHCFARRCGQTAWHTHGSECTLGCLCGRGEVA